MAANFSVLLVNNTDRSAMKRQILSFIVATTLTSVAGSAANVILLLALLTHRPLRKLSCWALLVYCIVLDLCISAVSINVDIMPYYRTSKTQLSSNFCTYEALFLYAPRSAGYWASTMLAGHRFAAAWLPLHYATLTKRTAIVAMMVFPWVMALVGAAFPLSGTGVNIILNNDNQSVGCRLVLSGPTNILLMITVLQFYLPLFLMGVCYAALFGKSCVNVANNPTSRSMRRQMEISRTLFFSFLWLCVVVFPPLIIVATFRGEYLSNSRLHLATVWWSNCFPIVNPVRQNCNPETEKCLPPVCFLIDWLRK